MKHCYTVRIVGTVNTTCDMQDIDVSERLHFCMPKHQSNSVSDLIKLHCNYVNLYSDVSDKK